MSADRQRQNRLQGRFAAPKRKSLPVSPISSDQGPSFGSHDLCYKKTDFEIEQSTGPVLPVVLNDQPVMLRQWLSISDTDKGVSEIYFDPDFLSREKADGYFAFLLPHVRWEEKKVVVRGETYPQPRLVHWIGPYEYKYSSVSLNPNDQWPGEVLEIHDDLRSVPRIDEVKGGFNSVLLNLYRDEHDSVAWHSDNELSMGVKPFIASISLGDRRRFQLKRKSSPGLVQRSNNEAEYVVHLDHGSLIIMNGALQDDWLHRVPKEPHSRTPRINLTFRTVYKSSQGATQPYT